MSAGRAPTREGARYQKIARRRGEVKAQAAVGDPQLKACHKLLSGPGRRYHDLGPGYCERQAAIGRKISCHVREIEALGLDVTFSPRLGPGPEGTTNTQAA